MKKYIFITAMAAIVCLTGCKDFLVEDPILSQSDELTLSTYDGLNASVLGAYSPLAGGSWYNADFITSSELRTANGKKYWSSTWDTGRLNDWYNFTYSASNTLSVWSQAYYVISAANNVMSHLDAVEADEQDKNNLKAECLFLRAFSHFDLVRTYAQPYCYTSDASHDGVPVILFTDASDQSPRASVKEVYEQIVADLLEAEEIIDPSYVREDVTDERATVTLEVIQAMLARVYLYSQQWALAAEYATKVINSGKYEMWTVKDMDASDWNVNNMGSTNICFNQDTGSGEVIFEIFQTSGQSYGGSSNDNICGMTYYDGYGDAQATQELINSYDDADVRKTLFYEYTNADGQTGRWTLKYGGKGLSRPDVNNIIILRLSDMYLIRAEATANAGLNYSAMDDINMIRKNRGVSVYTTPPTAAQILEERRLEFAWEAHLWFDLARTGRAMTRTNDGDTSAPMSIAVGDREWAMPIPLREIQVNHNLVQNSGY